MHHPIKLHQRPHPSRRRKHITTIHPWPSRRRMEDQAHQTNMQPVFKREHLQRMEQQQAPDMAAQSIRQTGIHRR